MTNIKNNSENQNVNISNEQALEQYKVKMDDLGNLGTRQSSMTMYYISIVSAIFGLLALKERSISDIETSILNLLCCVGFLICFLWFLSINYFRNLFRAKLSVLSKMEATLPFQTFEAESKITSNYKLKSWMRIEQIIPVIFGLLFISLMLIRIINNL